MRWCNVSGGLHEPQEQHDDARWYPNKPEGWNLIGERAESWPIRVHMQLNQHGAVDELWRRWRYATVITTWDWPRVKILWRSSEMADDFHVLVNRQ